jgi:hypothetical protein
MRAYTGVAGALSVTVACFSNSPSSSAPTDGGVHSDGDRADDSGPVSGAVRDGGGSAVDGSSPVEASAPPSGCVSPDASACSYSGTGAVAGVGACSAQVEKSASGTAQFGLLDLSQTCLPLFEFTTTVASETLTPGTYTLSNTTGSAGRWYQNGELWSEQEQPAVEGSFTLTITEVVPQPDTDAGVFDVHGMLTVSLVPAADAGTVTAQATF